MAEYLKFRIDEDSGELFATPATLSLLVEMADRGDLWDMDILGDLFNYAESHYKECRLNFHAHMIVSRAKAHKKTIDEVCRDENGYPSAESYERAREFLEWETEGAS